MQTELKLGDGIRWPGGKKVAVMLTFDFDAQTLQHARFPGEKLLFADESRGKYGPDEGIWRCLKMLERQNIKATFFIPGYVIEHYKEQVEAVVQAGHEIAYHGYLHDDNYATIPPEEELRNMEKAEALIKSLTGKKPVGHRAPGGFPQAYYVDMLKERGYLYSSQLSPEISCDWAYAYERGGKKLPLVELCTDVMLDDFPYYFMSFTPPAHRHMCNNDMVYEIFQDEFDGRVEEADKIMVLKLHPSLIGRASRIRMVEKLVEYMKENGAWIATCEEVAEYVLKENGLERSARV
ncbi:polysaccharide deacetylase [Christensenellaceae bacterium OttesenSCG-928-M15]|nr:polysaccharide deacetylase [Christensenellaceae bacterium OttesenSCG-928-M15]